MRLLLIIAFIMASALAFAADKTTEVFTLDHQMSEMCQKRIKENLRFEKGIEKIDVSLKDNTITVTYNPSKTNTEKIIEGFRKIGFTAFPVTECEDTKEAQSCCVGPCCGAGSDHCE